MMSLSGSVLLNTLAHFRLAWIGGRYGGGKTALSVALGHYFYERGWVKHIISNFPCVLSTDLKRLSELKDTFIILDEAGAWMNERMFDSAVALLRKDNLYLVMPSVLPPPTRARTLNIQRTLNAQSIGLPLWTYTGSLNYMALKEKYQMNFWRPQEVFGLFDTSYKSLDDEGIIDAIISIREQGKGQDKDGAKTAAVPDRDGDSGLEEQRRIAETVFESAQAIQEALPVLERGSRRRGRRR